MDLTVGQKAERQLSVTAEKVRAYAEITGDFNPLHFDELFTAKTRFGRLLAQGGIVTGILNALVAMDMPGAGTVFIDQKWEFPAPVYIGDTITAEATVTWVHERKPVAKLAVVARNQDGDDVLTGEATIYQASAETG